MTNPRNLDRILRELEPELASALIASFANVRADVDYEALETAIAAYDIAGVEAALNLDEGSWAPYVMAATAIFLRYGVAFAPTLGVRFNPVMGPVQEDISRAVQRMAEETRQTIREVAAQTMSEPRDGDGRAGRDDRRERSRTVIRRIRPLIGLSPAQVSHVETMRRRLNEGDPKAMREILGSKGPDGKSTGGNSLRDKRYDPLIKRAIVEARQSAKAVASGLPAPDTPPVLTPAKVDEITTAYARKLAKRRAKDIAEAEVDQYAEAAKHVAAGQAADKVGGRLVKTWRHSAIVKFARVDHLAMSGRSVIGIDTPFVMPDGVAMRYAHDPRGGAKHNASCKCRTTYSVEKV